MVANNSFGQFPDRLDLICRSSGRIEGSLDAAAGRRYAPFRRCLEEPARQFPVFGEE